MIRFLPVLLLLLLTTWAAGVEKPPATQPAGLRLPHVFGDHMILQRDRPVPVWGWATPGANVIATFGPATASSAADATGRFEMTLPPQPLSKRSLALTVASGGAKM